MKNLEARKIQNKYQLKKIKMKVLNPDHYDQNGFLKPEYALSSLELEVMRELGLDFCFFPFRDEFDENNNEVVRKK